MRVLALWLVTAAWQLPAAQPASIRGTAIAADTGMPLAGVQVSAAGDAGKAAAVTDAHGEFVLSNLPAGIYRFAAIPDKDYALRTMRLTLDAGESLKGFEVRLERKASIAGHIRDELGNGIAGARLAVQMFSYRNGRLATWASSSTDTARDGSYRMGRLSPGSYHLQVWPKGANGYAVTKLPPGVESEPPPEFRSVITYYPNASSFDASLPITLAPGEVREGLDIVSAKVKTVCVTVTAAGEVTEPVWISLSSAQSTNEAIAGRTRAETNQRIQLCGIPAGVYRVMAHSAGKEPFRFAVDSVTVGNRSLEVPPLMLRPEFPVSGTVRVTGGGDAAAPGKLFVELEPTQRFAFEGESLSASVEVPGRFTIPSVLADHYHVTVPRLPRGYYIRGATVEGRDVFTAGWHADPASKLDIELGAGGPVVAGEVVDEKGRPVAHASIVLARDPLPEVFAPNEFLTADADQSGRFVLSGMPPGHYRLLPPARFVVGESNRPDVVRARLSSGVKLELTPGKQFTVKVTPRD